MCFEVSDIKVFHNMLFGNMRALSLSSCLGKKNPRFSFMNKEGKSMVSYLEMNMLFLVRLSMTYSYLLVKLHCLLIAATLYCRISFQSMLMFMLRSHNWIFTILKVTLHG